MFQPSNQSQYIDNGQTSPSTDPVTPSTWQAATRVVLSQVLETIKPLVLTLLGKAGSSSQFFCSPGKCLLSTTLRQWSKKKTALNCVQTMEMSQQILLTPNMTMVTALKCTETCAQLQELHNNWNKKQGQTDTLLYLLLCFFKYPDLTTLIWKQLTQSFSLLIFLTWLIPVQHYNDRYAMPKKQKTKKKKKKKKKRQTWLLFYTLESCLICIWN